MEDEVPIVEQAPGYYSIGPFSFQTVVASNHPFCHFCQKRVDKSVVVFPANGTNPRHLCIDCIKKILDGFSRLSDTVT